MKIMKQHIIVINDYEIDIEKDGLTDFKVTCKVLIECIDNISKLIQVERNFGITTRIEMKRIISNDMFDKLKRIIEEDK